jgi:hypothetical protein
VFTPHIPVPIPASRAQLELYLFTVSYPDFIYVALLGPKHFLSGILALP